MPQRPPESLAAPVAPVKRRRRWPVLLAVLLLVLVATAWWLARLLEPERLSAFVLARAGAATGLELELPQPADISLWPDLHIEMTGLRARAPGAPRPLFSAVRVDLVLPWSALLHREAVIRHLRLLEPQLDRDALTTWLAERERAAPPQPLQLPELTATLSIEGGRVGGSDDDAWRLHEIDLETTALHPGEPFHAAFSAMLLGVAAEPLRIAFALDTVPVMREGVLSLDPLRIALELPDAEEALPVEGHLVLDHPRRLQLQLAGTIAAWPAAWPELPADDAGSPTVFTVAYEGPSDGSGEATLHAERSGASLDLRSSPTAVVEWAAAADGSPLPPLDGGMQAQTVEVSGATLRGVTIELERDAAEPDLQPASETSAEPEAEAPIP